ncbi:MAG TPA: hypothetical protein VG820_01050, partial [Fimbriimonadaceae bacterium]|nr:hypothetical protein [Fimbriimonadaceae bacterium]
YLVVSPYNRRRVVDSNLYTTVSMLKSIEMMLGLDPMNRFDSFAKPIDSCFTDQLDLTPYTVKPNQTPLDLPNPGRVSKATGDDEYWAEKTRSLDWSHLDAPDNYWLNRIIWASLHKDGTPYPAREGEAPGQEEDD